MTRQEKQEKISEISSKAIRDLRHKTLAEMYQLVKPETNEVNKFYNAIIHSVITATQKAISAESLMVR